MADQPTADERAAQIHKEADARKTDPRLGEGVIVDRGDEGRPSGKRNTFADRRAMYDKSDQMRRDGRPRSGDDVVDTSGAPNPDERPQDRTLHLNKPAAEPVKPGAAAPSQTASNAGSEYVTLQLEQGGSITVSRSDIEAAGGQEGYLRRRRDEEQDLRTRTQERELDGLRNQLAESERLRAELARQRAGDGSPASRVDDPSTQQRNVAGTVGVDDLETRAKALAKDIYSGDQADAERAIKQILAGQQGQSLSVDEVVRRATEALRREATQTTEPVKTAPLTAAMQAMNEQINDMSKRDFADVVQNPEARAAAYQRFLVEVRKPENKDRRAIDVARDSMLSIRDLFKTEGHPRADVIESKRGLPSSAVASGAQAPVEAEAEDSRSYIDRLSQSRNFSRRPQ